MQNEYKSCINSYCVEHYSVPMNVRKSVASAISIPVECGEHKSLPVISSQFLSSEAYRYKIQ